ncbi:MAG: nuclear transport factor 2 family protein [Polyangiaceae bacterium]
MPRKLSSQRACRLLAAAVVSLTAAGCGAAAGPAPACSGAEAAVGQPSSSAPPPATAPVPSAPSGEARAADLKAIEAVLDDFHDAAAKADEGRYFGHLAEDAVFLGTDAAERWDKAAFLAYSHPHFAKGKAWAFRAVRRAVVLSPSGDSAWFDEDLATERLGPARGSGALVRTASGWSITLYNLTIPIPNDRFDAVRRVIAGEAAPGSR